MLQKMMGHRGRRRRRRRSSVLLVFTTPALYQRQIRVFCHNNSTVKKQQIMTGGVKMTIKLAITGALIVNSLAH